MSHCEFVETPKENGSSPPSYTHTRAVGRSENQRGQALTWRAWSAPLAGIGLTKLPKSSSANTPLPPSRFPRPYLLWCNDKKWSQTRASKSKNLFHFLGHHKIFANLKIRVSSFFFFMVCQLVNHTFFRWILNWSDFHTSGINLGINSLYLFPHLFW